LSNVYYESSQGVLVRKADLEVYTSADALKGKKLGAQMGSIQEEMANSIENAEVKSLPLTTSLLVDLKTEKIDAIIMEAPVAKQYANNDEELAVPDFVFESAEKGAAIGVKKENTDLLQFINETLDELKADGSIDKFVVDAINLSNEQAQ
jgi:polar amino acid ABC superfamily ATP binding cassette transporter amino acid-binding protein